jgi:signal peptidase I
MKRVGLAITLAATAILGSLFLILDDGSSMVTISGNSMAPTLMDGATVSVSRHQSPDRLDVVCYVFPLDEERMFVGRIIGLPGDVLEVREGAVWINGQKAEEPYVLEATTYRHPQTVLPSEEYFILGDNRNGSYDSHDWGSVPRSNILAVVDFDSAE